MRAYIKCLLQGKISYVMGGLKFYECVRKRGGEREREIDFAVWILGVWHGAGVGGNPPLLLCLMMLERPLILSSLIEYLDTGHGGC